MGISVIKYNILNLPDTILFANGNRIINLYDAAGRKYKSIVHTNIANAVTSSYDLEHAALGWFGTGAFGAAAIGAAPYVLTAVAIYGVADFGVTITTGNSISGWIGVWAE